MTEWLSNSRAVLIAGNQRLTWAETLTKARAFAEQLQATQDVRPGEPFWVQCTDPLQCVVTFLAAMMAGFQPVMAPPRSAQRPQKCAPRINRPPPLTLPNEPEAVFADPDRISMTFRTSGSTGHGAAVPKSWRAIHNEINHLAKLYPVEPQSRWASCVPPWHYYGFTVGIMLPIFFDAKVHLLASATEPWIPATDTIADADVMVTVPAMWPLIREAWSQPQTRLIFSAAAPLGAARIGEYLHARQTNQTQAVLVDLLGTTEVGTYAHRTFTNLVEINPPFCAYDVVSIEPSGDAAVITTPFIATENKSFILSDRLTFVNNKQFNHEGRRDRVVKIAGLRVSLTTVEHNLAMLCKAQEVICHFVESQDIGRGGRIIAFIESSPRDIRAMRSEYLSRFGGPFPSQVHFLRQLPRNSMGKIVLKDLEKAASAEI